MESGNLMKILVTVITLIAANYTQVYGSGEGKVKLELYYEALCPWCAKFIVNFIPKLFENGLIHITDVKLYPFGNGYVRPDGTIVCQHGKDECLLNTVEACALDACPTLKEHFPFIYCVENLAYNSKHSQWKTCLDKLNVKAKSVVDCFENGRGNELELKYAAEIDALEPTQEYVPWVVVDGEPLYDDYENFISYICKAYKGTTPPACTAISLQKGRKMRPFCSMKTTSKLAAIMNRVKLTNSA